MKNFFTISFVAFLLPFSFAQQTETLQHFNPDEITPVVENYSSGQGYYTGHNHYNDEEFAEKYEIEGTGKVHGILAIHDGIEGTAGSLNASYRVFTVASNGLPQNSIASKSMSYGEIPVNGTFFNVEFTNPVNVAGQFFVSFNLGDYAHGGLGTKRIALTHAPHGTRPDSDFGVFGRNAIRWHTHGGSAVWKDYRTENFTSYEPAVYFSLFPIVELDPLSTIEFENNSNVGNVYPNPSNGEFQIPIRSQSSGIVKLSLLDMSGNVLSTQEINVTAANDSYTFSKRGLTPGVYLLYIETAEGSVVQRVIIKDAL